MKQILAFVDFIKYDISHNNRTFSLNNCPIYIIQTEQKWLCFIVQLNFPWTNIRKLVIHYETLLFLYFISFPFTKFDGKAAIVGIKMNSKKRENNEKRICLILDRPSLTKISEVYRHK